MVAGTDEGAMASSTIRSPVSLWGEKTTTLLSLSGKSGLHDAGTSSSNYCVTGTGVVGIMGLYISWNLGAICRGTSLIGWNWCMRGLGKQLHVVWPRYRWKLMGWEDDVRHEVQVAVGALVWHLD